LAEGPNSVEAAVGLSADETATASAPSAADVAAANAALGSVAASAPASISTDPTQTGLAGMVSQALDGLSSVVDGLSTAMDRMGGFAPPGISAAVGFAEHAIGLAKSVMDGFQTGDWSGVTDGIAGLAADFSAKVDAAKQALDAIRQGDWGTALEAAAKVSKSAEKAMDIVNLVQSARTSADTGNWGGTFQAARAF